MSDKLLLLIGTTKGIWTAQSDSKRKSFELTGPHLPGREIYSVAFDSRNGRILAGISSMHWGSVVSHSDDLGKTWHEPAEGNVKFPEGADWSLKRVWQLQPAGADQPEVVYAGIEPASLFRSENGGASFDLMKGLYDHPHRPQWNPGNGGLCLHSILIHPDNPDKMFIAISTGGVYRSEDRGDSWTVSNVGVRAQFLPDKYPEFGQCVHKIAMNPKRPDTLFLQNHWGLYRTDDGAKSWTDIANGVPSDFGFPMVVHPHDPETAYIVPLEGDFYRCTPEGKCRVYRTKDSGKSWEALTEGLPQTDAHVTVLRDGMAADTLDPAGIYFGTRTGEVYSSNNEGDSWNLLAQHLPPVMSVKAAVLN